ncbi:unnamed protein product [Urochloa decumbens]|uniref:Integral membrane protein n=1 Tax=Urochloa decumbens TaxID=240449 RepID=A0ABC9EB59_9POAL
MGDHGMAYAPQADEPEAIGGAGGGRPGGALNNAQLRYLRAGRILVTGGWLVLINTTIGNRGTNAGHTIVGLALLLLGVFLIVLSPVASQFPGAVRVGAAVADAVLFYFFAPGN